MTKSWIAPISVMTLALLTAACSGQLQSVHSPGKPVLAQNPAPPGADIEVPVSVVKNDWEPTNINIFCGSKRCPEGVGVLLFAGKRTATSIPVVRCTAFLIQSDRIVSNGHCDHFSTQTGYFLLRGRAGKTVVRHISGVLYKAFTENPKDSRKTSGRPDVLVLQLDKPIEGVDPMPLNTVAATPFEPLTAYVSNEKPTDHGMDYVIEERVCNYHRHEAYLPFAAAESPDVLRAFDCDIVGGNSGSPLVGSSGLVEAIVQAGEAAPGGDPRMEYEKHQTMTGTNLRCLDFLGGNSQACLVADEVEINRRFAEAQKQAWGQLEKLEVPDPATYETGFEAYAFQLKTAAGDFHYQFEVIYKPSCRKGGELSKMIFPSRHLKMTFDEWAVPGFTALELRSSPATVTAHQGDLYEVEVAWAYPFLEHMKPELDLRRRFGPRFSIALPPCAR